MFIARLTLEVRFKQISFPYLAGAMKLSAQFAEKYPNFQTDGKATQFESGQKMIRLEPAKLVLNILVPESPHEMIPFVADTLKTWTSVIGPLPELSRIGVRAQVVAPNEMRLLELADLAQRFALNDNFRVLFPQPSDFMVVLERFENLEGFRYVCGVMEYEELLQKWQYPDDVLEKARCYLTHDFDIGSTKAGARDIESVFRKSWERIHQTVDIVTGAIVG